MGGLERAARLAGRRTSAQRNRPGKPAAPHGSSRSRAPARRLSPATSRSAPVFPRTAGATLRSPAPPRAPLSLLTLRCAHPAPPGRRPGGGRVRGAAPPASAPGPRAVVERPSKRVLIHEGQDGPAPARRALVLPQDDTWSGRPERWFEQRDLIGWSAIAGAPQLERPRHDAEPRLGRLVPQGVRAAARAARAERFWKVRFEGSNYRTTVWLNGRPIGSYTRLLPVRGRPERATPRAQHARRQGLDAAQPQRPDPLAPRRLQRLRHRWLVELRRPPARGLRAPDRHRRHRAGPRVAAPALRWAARRGSRCASRSAT